MCGKDEDLPTLKDEVSVLVCKDICGVHRSL